MTGRGVTGARSGRLSRPGRGGPPRAIASVARWTPAPSRALPPTLTPATPALHLATHLALPPTPISALRRAPSRGWTRALALACVVSWVGQAAGAGTASPREDEAWFELRTPALTLVSNVHEGRAAELTRDLAAFRHVLEREIPGLRPAARPLTVYAFDSRRTLRRYYPSAPRAVGGVFLRADDRDVILVDAGTRLRQQHAYHEYVHFRLRDSFLSLPAWLNEGLAYYYQTFRRIDPADPDEAIDTTEPPEPPPGRAEVGGEVPGLSRRSSTPLVVVLETTAASDDYATRGFARRSWELVHFLQSTPTRDAGRPALETLLASLADGHGSAAALSEATGQSLGELEAAWNADSRGGASRARTTAAAPAGTTDPPTSRRLAYADVLVRLAELLETTGGEATGGAAHRAEATAAQPLFERALTLAPGDTRALLGAARGRLAAGDLGGADQAVEEALRRAPEDAEGYRLRGVLKMARFGEWRRNQADGGPQVLHPLVLTARQAFQRAMSLDPERSSAVRGYARTFLFDPETRRPGIEACLSALQRRDDLDLALTLVELYSDDADRDAAHEARTRRVLPWRDWLDLHGSPGPTAPWTRVESALANHDMLLAERLYEAGRHAEALDLLRAARDEADGATAESIGALLADMASRSTR